MVFDNLENTVRGLLGEKQNSVEEQKSQNVVDKEFAEMYSNEIVVSLENQQYERVEQLVEPIDKEFGEIMGDYIEERLTSATAVMNYFDETASKAEESVREAAREIGKLKNSKHSKRRLDAEKRIAEPDLVMADNYVGRINSDDSTEAMRNAFRAFHAVGLAAEYVEHREGVELEEYRPEKVKMVANRKASEMKDMDREMGMDFMVPEYNKLVEAFNNL